ncbi:MAG: hypothetical protein LBI17_02155 [Rickettsiales bacterium]|jgi:hypothetical protein|nr:hypothetical protein [Rickettsiales bacterium]
MHKAMEEDEMEVAIVSAINEYYKFGEFTQKNEAWRDWPAFKAPLGSTAMARYLDMKDENVQVFINILDRYSKLPKHTRE